MPLIKKTYIDTGQVRYVFKDLPLSFHANAQKAAEAGRCAGAQGAFWEMHDALFEFQSEWSRQESAAFIDTLVGYATKIGLDGVAFRGCLESGQFTQLIAQSIKEARQAGITGTPSFLINDQLLVGAYPFEDFQRMIQAELEK